MSSSLKIQNPQPRTHLPAHEAAAQRRRAELLRLRPPRQPRPLEPTRRKTAMTCENPIINGFAAKWNLL